LIPACYKPLARKTFRRSRKNTLGPAGAEPEVPTALRLENIAQPMRKLFVTEKTPGTWRARILAMLESIWFITTPSRVTWPLFTMM